MTERSLTELREQIRVTHGRDPEPTAGIIDSQSVQGADTVPRDSCGYDAGKRINGRTDPISDRKGQAGKDPSLLEAPLR
ncbi:hypothetical protein ACGFIW_19275 [Micromonospora sp. NPDC048935]|uniref:hypothetical protein n=1 Tax=Micromonospora sp. NPDC048935 TaxID=3364262 RepID=UPI0037136E75